MKTSQCECGNSLFFNSVECVACGAEAGVCEECNEIANATTRTADTCCCGVCQKPIKPCANRWQHGVCNTWMPANDSQELCLFCRLTSVIPDLSVPGNIERWRALEAAKRRVLVGLQDFGFPLEEGADGGLPRLTFAFKADGRNPVFTGHDKGCITINIREADPVEREKARVEFGEPQRTLVGHFRHELGHYYWELLVEPYQLDPFREVFGHELNPSYGEAKQKYYQQGPPRNWRDNYISAYATMHPWEDFAETFNAVLDMQAVLNTADSFKLLPKTNEDRGDFDEMLIRYQKVGIIANEMNRDIGLLDLVPEIISQPVKDKMRFVHGLAALRAAESHS